MLKVLWSNFRWLTLSLYKKACVYVIASLSNYFKRANYSKENALLKEKKTNMFERDGDTKFIKILTVRPTVSTIWVEHKNICSKITQQIQIDAQMEKLDEDWNGLNLFILDPQCLRFWLIYVSSGKHLRRRSQNLAIWASRSSIQPKLILVARDYASDWPSWAEELWGRDWNLSTYSFSKSIFVVCNV